MDTVEIVDLRVRCVLGVTSEERRAAQEVLISLWVGVDAQPAMARDELDAVWDYRAATKAVLAMAEDSSFQTVERLAGEVAAVCLAMGAMWARVGIHKPGALRFAQSVGVVVERQSPDSTTSPPIGSDRLSPPFSAVAS
jgi:FolB domain-containing protein